MTLQQLGHRVTYSYRTTQTTPDHLDQKYQEGKDSKSALNYIKLEKCSYDDKAPITMQYPKWMGFIPWDPPPDLSVTNRLLYSLGKKYVKNWWQKDVCFILDTLKDSMA